MKPYSRVQVPGAGTAGLPAASTHAGVRPRRAVSRAFSVKAMRYRGTTTGFSHGTVHGEHGIQATPAGAFLAGFQRLWGSREERRRQP